MKIVSWNVNSLKARAEHVARYLEESAPDVLCLQELKLPDERVPRELFEAQGYHLAVHGQKQWNGVLIASRTPLEDIHCGLEGGDEGQSRLVAATTEGIRIVNLYCPQGQDVESPKFAYKLAFYERLTGWLEESSALSTPLVVLGDLNIAPGPDDVWSVEDWEGRVSYTDVEHRALDKLMALGLVDATRPYLPPGTFTFWDYRQLSFRRKRGLRIDLILVNEPVLARVSGAWVDREERKRERPSDHAPVGLALD